MFDANSLEVLAELTAVDLRTMPTTFEPRLYILAKPQQLLWPELDAVPSDFVLYGGTGLALQVGPRISDDFDFFSSSAFDPDRLLSRLSFFRDLDPTDPDLGCIASATTSRLS